jgi:hypothetical protein
VFIDVGPAELVDVFAAPRWLRDGDVTAWLLVGVVPLIAAVVAAAVTSPLVGGLERHRVSRPVGAVLLLLAIVLLATLVVYIVLAGITSEVGRRRIAPR